ncbi:uncharacterized protein PGTG_04980 [Puccinia graminis f. sp. tritici CRL 75-36-700-3]|uniref:Uncharacterized protein n=1 Tax=Puccinia graminis f. sp. tritici (strain CRL 75-36-700-3 / race SCCL) TaxID=418459 RepID=E3K3G7_PUCGT|nr:uncharacterized protein PGTG_04980 [Puccinia graminis f. sp. tritici CRL 75-36-700-3]EFP79024.1 hypothetical protein PGTG_04980 [Puccinia graminis f. sp. tritici CRL 75-36-700-3]
MFKLCVCGLSAVNRPQVMMLQPSNSSHRGTKSSSIQATSFLVTNFLRFAGLESWQAQSDNAQTSGLSPMEPILASDSGEVKLASVEQLLEAMLQIDDYCAAIDLPLATPCEDSSEYEGVFVGKLATLVIQRVLDLHSTCNHTEWTTRRHAPGGHAVETSPNQLTPKTPSFIVHEINNARASSKSYI